MPRDDRRQDPGRPSHPDRGGNGPRPSSREAPDAVERLTTLTHDLANILQASMRCLGLARRQLVTPQREAEAPPRDEMVDALDLLDTVRGSLERMTELIHSAMSAQASPVAGVTLAPASRISLAEAVAHAVDVLAPECADLGARVETSVDGRAGSLPAGPVYPVLLNGIRNALDALRVAGDEGRIRVSVSMGDGESRAGESVVIEIVDDGPGVGRDARRLFEPGVSTKPRGAGVGLSIARDIVRELGGSIALMPGSDRSRSGRPGAVLRVTYPASSLRRSASIG